MQIRRPHPLRALRARAQARADRRHAAQAPKAFTVFYDFDGTLANTVNEMLRIYNEMAQEKGYTLITQENIVTLRTLGMKAASEVLGISPAYVPVLLMQGKRRLVQSMGQIPFCVGMHEVVRKLHKRGCSQVIATSNSKKNVSLFLRAHASEQVFDYLECNIGIMGKARRLRKVMQREGLNADGVVYVGDELRDIEAARSVGIRVIAVTWGLNDASALEAAQPDYIARTPEKLERIIAKICKV